MLRSLALAGVLGLATAARASADVFSTCFTNGSLSACTSANLESLGGTNYKVTLTHLGGHPRGGFNLTGFGFYAAGPDVGKLATLVPTIAANWADAPPTGTVSGGPDSPTAIPEPATMALLATGLVGLGAASVIRRRRRKNTED